MNSVAVKVAENIKTLGPSVETKVVEALVARECNKRSDALVQAMDKLSRFQIDMKKLKPDQIAYNDKREVVSETYSKSRLDEMEKLQKQIDKLTNAINKALEKSDFGDVYNLASGKDTGGATAKSD